MKDMRSQAKASSAAKLRAITGENPVAKAATKYATNDSGQTEDTQKVPTRANGGQVMGPSYMSRMGAPASVMTAEGDNETANSRFQRNQWERDQRQADNQAQRRLDRPMRTIQPGQPPRVGVRIGPTVPPPTPRPGVGAPISGGLTPIPGLPGSMAGGPGGGMPGTMAGGPGLSAPTVAPPTPLNPVGGADIGGPTPAFGSPLGAAVPPMGGNPMMPPVGLGSQGFKRGGAVKIGKGAKPFPAKGAPKGGAGGGLGRLQDAAAQKRAPK